MSVVNERIYIAAPFSQARSAFEERLGLAPGERHGTCSLVLAFPFGEGREIARPVSARTERRPDSDGYSAHYAIGWDAGTTARGIPTPGFAGTLSLRAGEDYSESALELDGRYDPPGGAAGRAFDEVLGRRVAHATLTALLNGVGQLLRETHERTEAAKGTR